MRVCYQCRMAISLEEPIGRRDTCAGCGAEVRCCLNCAFYDARAADACREPQADLVQHKDRANFCEFFALGDAPSSPARPSAADARAQLDALFKKKS